MQQKKNFDCPKCKLMFRWFFWTSDEKEIKEALEKEVNASLKICWNVAKNSAKLAHKNKGTKEFLPLSEKLIDYIHGVDPFDTTFSEMRDGFLREPRNKTEWRQAELHHSEDGFEWDDDFEDVADYCDSCKKYLATAKSKKNPRRR